MGKKRVLLAIGHNELENRIRSFDIDVIDSASDIDVIADILSYEQVDFVIVNTLLSQSKTLSLAVAANEQDVKVIAIVEDITNKGFIAALVSNEIYGIAEIDKLNKVNQFLSDYPDDFDFSSLEEPKTKAGKGKEEVAGNVGKVTVSVMGVMPRIGTTTQSLSLAKHLCDQGYKACYIECNGSGYVKMLAETYEDAKIDDKHGKASYLNLDMFYKMSELSLIVKMPYQYYIYDYGNLKAAAAELSWQEKDILVLCAGTKPNELVALKPALEMLYERGAKYIYSFSPSEEHNEVRDAMRSASKDTFFASYRPDPFNGGEEWYPELLQTSLKPAAKITDKKWGFLRGRGWCNGKI